MSDATVGLLNPGEMGAAVGQCLAAAAAEIYRRVQDAGTPEATLSALLPPR